MLKITAILLGIIALVAAVCAFVFFRLYKREKKVSKITSVTSPSTINAINALEAARRPDEAFFIRMVKSLKSPLTLVSGPLEQLESRGTLSSEDARLMNVMKNGVTRMERIVSQLSDFSQPDFSGLRLCLDHSYPVCEKIRQDMGYFRSNAELLGIKVDEEGIGDGILIPLDLEKFDIMFQNTLYATLKFVFREGEVKVSTSVLSGEEVSAFSRSDPSVMARNYFMLSIFHSGEILDEDTLEAIFGREYVYLDTREFAGVGLYYTRELAESHKGYMWASNSENGDGVYFCIALPVDEDFYPEDDYRESVEKDGSVRDKEKAPLSSFSDDAVSSDGSGRKTVLIVEEDSDVLAYLTLLLEKDYIVKGCSSNAGAMEEIEKGIPDVVISDVSNSSGEAISLCRMIRRDDLTCRTPFIMLTDERKDDSNVDILQAGADAMLEKPFKPSMLTALIESLLRRMDLSQGHLIDLEGMLEEGKEVRIVSEEDRLLFEALCSIIREQASNPDLTVPALCDMLHISRTKLYNKVNGMVGMSPKRFLHEYRLKIAAQMLSEGRMTVGEVADATGFNSLSYFSKAFRKRYGKIPSQMKK